MPVVTRSLADSCLDASRSRDAACECVELRFDVVDSTNEVAKRLVEEGRFDGRGWVAAREQTAGKGQRGRAWASPPGAGVYLSVVDRPGECKVGLPLYTQAAGVACATVIREETGLDVRLKPINDLMIERRKLGGILCEVMMRKGRPEALVIGVGLNVRSAPRPVASSAALPVSLQDALAPDQFAHLDVEALTRKLARSVLAWNERLAAGELRAMYDEWDRFRAPEFDAALMAGGGT